MRHAGCGFARLIAAIALLLLCAGAVGCIAFPSKMTTRRYGGRGVTLQNADVDLSFIRIGVTAREEVATRLAAVDVNSLSEFFWGRWTESSWGVVGGSLTTSNSLAPVAGSLRHWHYRNILIRFNQQGTVASQSEIDNDEALWRQLTIYLRNSRSPGTGRNHPHHFC